MTADPPVGFLVEASLAVDPTYGTYNVNLYNDGSEYGPDFIPEDITEYVRYQDGIQISRGSAASNATTMRAEAASLTLTLDNRDRRFDPLFTTGPYALAGVSHIQPGVGIRVRPVINNITYGYIFWGTITGWPLKYPGHGHDQTVTVQATDAIGPLSKAQITVTRPPELPGSRIRGLLHQIYYNLQMVDIDTGQTTITALINATVSAWSTLADTAEADWGDLYITKDGNLRFVSAASKQRYARRTPKAIFGDGTSLTSVPRYLLSGDQFGRANNSVSAGSTDGDGTQDPLLWHPHGTAVWGTTSDTLYASTATGNITVDLGEPDMDINITILVSSTSANGIILRYTDDNNFIGYIGDNTQLRLIEFNGGVSTVLIASVGTIAANDTLRVTAIGPNYTIYHNGTSVGTAITSFNQQATKAGLRSFDTAQRFNDWFAYGTAANKPELPVWDVTVSYDDSLIYNQVKTIYSDTGLFVTANSTSQNRPWGMRSLTRSLPILNRSDALGMANFLVSVFAFPRVRFSSLALKPMHTPSTMFPQIAGRELGDRITVKLTPKGGGSRITRDVWIRGINHNITASDWTTTYALEDATFADNYAYYDIDSYDTATATGTAAVCEYGF